MNTLDNSYFITNTNTILTRWYVGSRYIKQTEGSTTKQYTWIGGDAYTAPVVAEKVGSTTTYFYLLRDYLGNITHKVNTTNNVVAEYSYDAWGRRRDKDDWHYTLTGEPDLTAARGFTSHEYLPWFNIVNMNGRLYDPLVGRFLSPDNYIQNLINSQNYNRYSYVLNNPLRYTDPTGEKWKWPKLTWFHAIPIIGQIDYVMQMINDNTTELSQKMVELGVPNFGVGYNTAHGGYHYVGNSGEIYHRQPGSDASQVVNNKIAEVRKNYGAAWRAASGGGVSADYLLPKLYWHYQFGGGVNYNLNASTLDFSNTSQKELGLVGMKVGNSKGVNLFNSGINPNSLAFGKLTMTYQGSNQFSIASNRFDFDYQSNSSFGRNAGTFIGGAVFGQFYTVPITPFSIVRDVSGLGGSFMINFNGTVTIPY